MYIHLPLTTVASRISVNYLYKNLSQRWYKGPYREPVKGRPPRNVYVCMIVEITKILSKQYLKHFRYEVL